ncbi:MAG: class I SAM-dependent methyltransferase [Phycisphaerales bacterium]|nr:class I SAM-dependent methyltransferase [Phycisphaerales bacterium]
MSPITALSESSDVRMADEWFDFAHASHFWMQRRFEVLQAMLDDIDLSPLRMAEIGCGSGVVLGQFLEELGIAIDGFDLNQSALEHAAKSRPELTLACYDILEERADLRHAYDGLFLLDVLEHIEDDAAFLRSARAHLKPGGMLALNVPGSMKLFSRYDEIAGHVRRYEPEGLHTLALESGFTVDRWSWWGRPFRPFLALRKHLVRNMKPDNVIRRGFKPPGHITNGIMRALGRCEHIPQHDTGCSIMMVLRSDAQDTTADAR